MDVTQFFFQLGGIGAVLFVVYRLSLVQNTRGAKADEERTEAFKEGMVAMGTSIGDAVKSMSMAVQSLGGKLDTHAAADALSHKEMTEKIATFQGTMIGMIEERRAYTPVHGTPITTADRPTAPYSHVPRNKTNG